MKTTLILLFALIGFTSFSQSDSRKSQFNTKYNVAIQGYDPVSYFKGNPTQGKKEYSYTYQSIIYKFSSSANKEKFIANPEKYEPQYGGWCAYAMGATGEKIEIDPETYKIVDGKLYLFYNAYFNNTLTDWNKNQTNLKAKADKNWAKFYKA